MSASAPFGAIIPTLPVQTNPIVISPTQFAFTFTIPTTANSLSSPSIVIFLLPGTVLPPDTLAAIYIHFPRAVSEFKLLGALSNERQSAIFNISGNANVANNNHNIHNNNTNGDFSAAAAAIIDDEMIDDDNDIPSTATVPPPTKNGISSPMPLSEITIGISIEPVASIAPQLAALATESSPSSSSLLSSTSSPQNTLILPTSKRLIPQTGGPLQTKVLAQRIIKNAFNFLASFSGTTATTTVGGRPATSGEEMVPLKSFRDWWVKFERRIENDPGFLERDADG